jgi:hypothetical protein
MDDRRPAQAGAQNPAYRPTHPLYFADLGRSGRYASWFRSCSVRATARIASMASHVERDVLTTMLPDDAEVTGENHPWEWLASLIRNHGMAELPRRGHAQPIERQGQ